jgi:dTDP-4-dehydrorhamnose reductase
MRIAITGTSGLFGKGMIQALAEEYSILPLPHVELDLTDRAAVFAALNGEDFDLLIHPAGIPDIDLCQSEPKKCWDANVEATQNLCDAANEMGFGFALISSDAVFDGHKTTPYVESDPLNPPTVYGKSKVAAEKLAARVARHWIFRVSVLFGPGKTNFVEKGIRTLQKDEKYLVASDQVGSATYTLDAAAKIVEVCRKAPSGIYHLSNTGACSRYELAAEAARLAGFDPARVVGMPLVDLKRAAPRLKYSVMQMTALRKARILSPRPWQDALREYVASLGKRSREKSGGSCL